VQHFRKCPERNNRSSREPGGCQASEGPLPSNRVCVIRANPAPGAESPEAFEQIFGQLETNVCSKAGLPGNPNASPCSGSCRAVNKSQTPQYPTIVGSEMSGPAALGANCDSSGALGVGLAVNDAHSGCPSPTPDSRAARAPGPAARFANVPFPYGFWYWRDGLAAACHAPRQEGSRRGSGPEGRPIRPGQGRPAQHPLHAPPTSPPRTLLTT